MNWHPQRLSYCNWNTLLQNIQDKIRRHHHRYMKLGFIFFPRVHNLTFSYIEFICYFILQSLTISVFRLPSKTRHIICAYYQDPLDTFFKMGSVCSIYTGWQKLLLHVFRYLALLSKEDAAGIYYSLFHKSNILMEGSTVLHPHFSCFWIRLSKAAQKNLIGVFNWIVK